MSYLVPNCFLSANCFFLFLIWREEQREIAREAFNRFFNYTTELPTVQYCRIFVLYLHINYLFCTLYSWLMIKVTLWLWILNLKVSIGKLWCHQQFTATGLVKMSIKPFMIAIIISNKTDSIVEHWNIIEASSGQ